MMTPTIIEEYILPDLARYIDRYRWDWSITRRVINRYYGTQYSQKQLKALYMHSK